MDLFAITFYLFAFLIIGAALIMVLSKNIMRAAFSLMFTLAGLAVFYAMLYAGFVAVTQLLVYVGGILVLILFGIMLTTHGYFEKIKVRRVHLVPSILFSSVIAALLISVFLFTQWTLDPLSEEEATLTVIGNQLLTDFMLPFQVAGVLLLLAIIGAVLMATQKKSSTLNPDESDTKSVNPDSPKDT